MYSGQFVNSRRAAVAGPLLGLICLLVVVACERPPINPDRPGSGGDADTLPEGYIRVATDTFINDRYALGAKWYIYGDNHILIPKEEIYLVADRDAVPEQYYAFDITSFHDAVTGASGHFTIEVAHWDGVAWETPAALTLSHTVYDGEAPICVHLGGPSEVDCASNAWHLSFSSFAYLAPISVFPLGTNPGISLRSTAGQLDRGALALAVVEATDLAALTIDPTGVGELADLPAQTFGTTEYDHAPWKPNLPQQGMTIGRDWLDGSGAGRGRVYFLRTFDRKIIKLRIDTPTPGLPLLAASLHYQLADDEGDGLVALEAAPVVDLPLTLASAYGVTFIDFTADSVQTSLAADLLHDPPNNREWDLAFESTDAGVQVLLSPGSLFWDWTGDPERGNGSTDFDAAVPPTY